MYTDVHVCVQVYVLKCRGSGRLHPVFPQVLTSFLYEERFFLSFLWVPLCEYENTMPQESIVVFSCLVPLSHPGLLGVRRRHIFNNLGETISIWELHFTKLTVTLWVYFFLVCHSTWRNVSMVMSTGCCSWEPGFESQPRCYGSQSVNIVSSYRESHALFWHL